MSPETKKKLLYGGGAVASIVALVLFMKNKGQSQPISSAGLGGGSSGAGGPSAGTSANNAAALNAATALTLEQSRQDAAFRLAGLQASTAIGVENIRATSQKDVANSRAMQSAFGPGGAATAAAPAIGKGIIDIIGEGFQKLYAALGINPNEKLPFENPSGASILDTDNPYDKAYGGDLYPYAGPKEIYGPIPDESFGNYVDSVGVYDNSGVPYYLSNTPNDYGTVDFADYYQGNSGGGDSSWFGGSYGNDGSGGSVPYYLAAANPNESAETYDYTQYYA